MLRAGIAKEDITNRGEEILDDNPFAAQAEEHIPEQFRDSEVIIRDPLYVRALVLENGDRRMAFIVLDTTAVGCRTITLGILADSADDFVPRLRREIHEKYGIPEDHVTVSATHTHPPRRILCSDDEQIARTLAAVGQAVESLRPVTIGVSTGSEERLTVNRTLRMKDGSDYTIRNSNPRPPDDAVEDIRPVDPEIGVLRIDGTDGNPVAVVYNFASHLLLGTPDGAITAGFAGVTSLYVEEAIGGDVMAMFVQGALGDVTEASKDDYEYGHPTSIENYGTTLAIGVMQAWRQATPGATTFNCVSESIDIPLRTDIPDLIEELREEQLTLMASLRYTNLNLKVFLPLYLQHNLHPEYPAHYFYRYRQEETRGAVDFANVDARNRSGIDKYLQSIRAMERMARNEEKIGTLLKQQAVIDILEGDSIPMEIQGVRIGDAVFITSPAEILTETGLSVKEFSPFENTFIASIANGYFHYAPPASYYPGGGYESIECLMSPRWEKAFVETTKDILGRLAQ